MSLKLLKVVLMGPPGSGKGTIATKIVKDFHMFHFSSGNLFRAHIRHETYLGREMQKYVERGELVPDDLISRVILAELETHSHVHCLVDGFPRTVGQAKFLQNYTPVDAVIELDVPRETIMHRVAQRWLHAKSGRIYNLEFNPPKVPGCDDVTGEPLTQRDDDKPETMNKRQDSYTKWEKPVSEYYKELGVLRRFSGTETNVMWPLIRRTLLDLLPTSAFCPTEADHSHQSHAKVGGVA